MRLSKHDQIKPRGEYVLLGPPPEGAIELVSPAGLALPSNLNTSKRGPDTSTSSILHVYAVGPDVEGLAPGDLVLITRRGLQSQNLAPLMVGGHPAFLLLAENIASVVVDEAPESALAVG